MGTLYIRDVSSATTERLKERAAANGQSLSAYVAAQLDAIAARPTNAEVVERLRRTKRPEGITSEAILAARDEDRR